MKVKGKFIYKQLDKLYEQAKEVNVKACDQLVIFSDLHMGDGSNKDDFKVNAELFAYALEKYYLKKQFKLVLNGDVEELQRYSMPKIHKAWNHVIKLFSEFGSDLHKTVGNHDLQLSVLPPDQLAHPIEEAIKLKFDEGDIFVFHGHQASRKYQRHNQLVGLTLKYFANPLGIKNYSVSHDSKKQYKIEKIAYHHAAYNKIVSIIGHTHRPLFESLHKTDRIRFRIEQLCREYATNRDQRIAKAIKALKKSLKSAHKEAPQTGTEQGYMYNSLFHLPCLFNSGTVIGKRGMTCLEIHDGKISLVHWFDKKTSKKYLRTNENQPQQQGDTDYYRMVINTDDLKYIFARVKLLS
ncbi:MAG: metallophosphoesterase [Bacteroidota bacterium]